MIKSNELRIGNKINYVGGENVLVYHITESVEIDVVADNQLYEPIPLTPEILDKAGFERKDIYGPGIPRLGKFEIALEGEDFRNALMTVLYDKKIMIKVGALHQLQNLYFALTGNELEINLNP